MSNGRPRLNWPQTLINLAHNIAQYRSEDPYMQVGACALKHDSSLVIGYNGPPSGVELDWSDRNARRQRVLHAEENVLNYVKPGEVRILACTHLPCHRCLNLIKQKKISLVYYSEPNCGSTCDPKEIQESAGKYGVDLIQLASSA